MKTWVSVTFLRVFNLDTEGNQSIRLEKPDEDKNLYTESNAGRPIPGITVTQLSRSEDEEVQKMNCMWTRNRKHDYSQTELYRKKHKAINNGICHTSL
jgi:hypothetical protein